MECYDQITTPVFQFPAPAGQEEQVENLGVKLSLGRRGMGGSNFWLGLSSL